MSTPEPTQPDVAIVLENELATEGAYGVAAWLRAKGLSAELYMSGSPRKRRDRAVKKGASEILTLDVRDGSIATRLSSTSALKVEQALADYAWPNPRPE